MSDGELTRKTYDLHVLAFQQTLMEFEGITWMPFIAFILAQRRKRGGLGVEKVETGTSGCQAQTHL